MVRVRKTLYYENLYENNSTHMNILKHETEENKKLREKLEVIMTGNEFLKVNRFWFMTFNVPDLKPYIYWIRFTKTGDWHGRTEPLNSNMSHEELLQKITMPKYLWEYTNKTKTNRGKIDKKYNNYIDLTIYVEKLKEKYPYNNIQLNSVKLKTGSEYFYLTYDVMIYGEKYNIRSSRFKETTKLDKLEKILLKKQGKYIIPKKETTNIK